MGCSVMDLISITHKEASALIDSELFDRISEGSGSLNPDYQYLAISTDDGIIGFWVIHYTGSRTLSIHINILERFRNEYALQSGWFFLNHVFSTIPGVERVECEIPNCYQDVIKFTQKFGFKIEGVKRKAITRNEILQDVHILGLLRSEYHGRS